MSCRNSYVDLFCIFAVVSVFCTVGSTDFAFSIMWSLSSRGGRDVSVFVAGGFGKPKCMIYFCDSTQNVYVSVGCSWFWSDVHFEM